MRPKSPFKQFAKDCPEHFSREILVKGKLPIFNESLSFKKEKSTSNSIIPNKF